MNILIPHSWLSEYFKTNLKPAEIADRLSLCGVSVEKVEKIVANGKAEYVYDIEVTSNRPDLLSVIGIAREAGAVFKKKCAFPALFKVPASDEMMPLRIEIRDPDLCPRYLGIVLQDIAVGPSPDFISERLKLSGLRPINNVVDITNYVMLEYGQPLHAFDWDLLEKNEKGEAEIIVRKAAMGEKMMTLDKQSLDLKSEMLVIADSAEPIALAGIKGGAKAEVTKNTKTIVLECANFDPVSVRKTSRQLSLPTDASARFEKGLSALGLEIPFGRAVYLLEKFAQGQAACSIQDQYPKKFESKKVDFNFATLERILGAKIPDALAQEILLSLGFKIKKRKGGLTATVPYWRYYDIGIEEDLIEEIARIYGYDHLKGKLLDTAIPAEARSKSFIWEEKARDILAGAGFTEVYTYSFASLNLLRKLAVSGEKYWKVENPLSQEFEYMRRSLLPGLLAAASENWSRSDAIKIFELSRVYLDQDKNMPLEEGRLAGLFFRKKGKSDLFYEIKAVVENLLSSLGVADFSWSKCARAKFLTEEAGTLLVVDNKKCGFFGLLKPALAANFKIKEKVFIFDLNFEKLSVYFSEHKIYKPLPRYPAISFDLSIIVDKKILWQEVARVVNGNGGKFLEKIEFIDVYRGEQIAKGEKGLFFKIVYRASDRSLKEEEVKTIHDRLVENLKKELGAKIRA